MRKILPKEEYCIGCQLCEIYCAVEHSQSKNILKAFKETPRPQHRISVEFKGEESFALSCRHCEDAPCIKACITGAMRRDAETGVIISEPEKCIGCWMCIMVCSFGAIRRGEDQKIALKCDFCPGASEPVCVVSCPQEALVFVEGE